MDYKLPIPVTIANSSNCVGGIGGSAGPGGLGFCAGTWAENHWCYGMLIQELCNYMTGKFGGWPSWWANHYSPFPILVSVEVLKQLGKRTFAEQRNKQFASDAWYARFKKLHYPQGFALWRALFAWLHEEEINLHAVPEPDKTSLVASMIAFLKAAT